MPLEGAANEYTVPLEGARGADGAAAEVSAAATTAEGVLEAERVEVTCT